MTKLEEKKLKLAKLEDALYSIALGERLTKGDVDGLGTAEFQTASPAFLERRIRQLKQEIAKAEGRAFRISGTPTNMGRCR